MRFTPGVRLQGPGSMRRRDHFGRFGIMRAVDIARRMKRHAGFTWIELVMVLAVIGILALMAIPVMSEGALRKQVKEGLELAEVAKTAVQTFYSLAGEFPPDNKAAGLPESEKIVGTMVRDVQVEG